jgi:hypothetical protein
LVPVRPCIVSFTDPEGFRHSVEVQAESLYEAVVLATRAFREHACAPGPASRLEVEVKSPNVTHEVTMRKVQEWLDGTCKSPNEKVTKQRLKGLLAG